MQSVPPCFVGPVVHLEAVVKLLCEQMVVAFKTQGLPVPPWRTAAGPAQQMVTHAAGRTSSEDSECAQAERGRIWRARWHQPAWEQHLTHMTASAMRSAQQQWPSMLLSAVHQSQQETTKLPWRCCCSLGNCRPGPAAADDAGAAGTLAAKRVKEQLQQQQQAPLCFAAGDAGIVAAAAAVNITDLACHDGTACWPVSSNGKAPSAVYAGPLGPPTAAGLDGSAGKASKATGDMTAVPLGAFAAPGRPFGVGVGPAVSGRAGPAGVSPAAADVMALLEAAEGLCGSTADSSTLKFTRKASAEWKHQRSNGRKMKGLLAAALKKPGVVASRSSLTGAVTAALPGMESAAVSSYSHMSANGSSCSAAAVTAGTVVAPAAAVTGGCPDGEASIRRTHYRATGDEPWRRITTVRWGAYAPAAAAAGGVQLSAQMQPAQQTPRPLTTT